MQSSTSLPTDLYVRSHFSTMLADMQSLAATMSLPYPSSNSSTASSRIFLSCFGGIKKPPISRTLLSCPRNGRQFTADAPPDATRPGMLPGLIERNTDSTAWLKAY